MVNGQNGDEACWRATYSEAQHSTEVLHRAWYVVITLVSTYKRNTTAVTPKYAQHPGAVPSKHPVRKQGLGVYVHRTSVLRNTEIT